MKRLAGFLLLAVLAVSAVHVTTERNSTHYSLGFPRVLADVSDYSTTAASNTTVGSGGTGIAEGMPPSDVNNAIRDLIADLATWRNDGYFGSLIVGVTDGTGVTGTFEVNDGTNSQFQVTANGEILSSTNPAFLAINSIQDDNVTGDGTTKTVEFDTEIYDKGADYNNGTDTFTAPVAGIYEFCTGLYLAGLTSSHTQMTINVVTSNRSHLITLINAAAAMTASNQLVGTGCVLADMDAADTATITTTVSNGALAVDLIANPTIPRTWFSGRLVQ